jgi:aminoglycoside phosphotransferase family enzyme
VVVDWLVQMLRLPSGQMLDAAIMDGTVRESDVRPAAEYLTRFYLQAFAVELTPDEYRNRLADSIRGNRRDLAHRAYQLPGDHLDGLTDSQLAFLTSRSQIFDERVKSGRVIEAHGDLRPEHICLKDPPVIIDCLEFNRDLRLLDIASELAFLALECERLGAAWVGDVFFDTYLRTSGDRPSPELLDFYRTWHACTRARIAL